MKRGCPGEGSREANVLEFMKGSFSYDALCIFMVIFLSKTKISLELLICFKKPSLALSLVQGRGRV